MRHKVLSGRERKRGLELDSTSRRRSRKAHRGGDPVRWVVTQGNRPYILGFFGSFSERMEGAQRQSLTEKNERDFKEVSVASLVIRWRTPCFGGFYAGGG